jgi:hypothetical protein
LSSMESLLLISLATSVHQPAVARHRQLDHL